MARPLILAALAATLAATPALADDLQTRLVAGARAAPAGTDAFRRTIVSEATGQTRKTIVETFDPRRPAGRQWVLVSVDGRAPNPKELARAAKARRETPSYAELAKWLGAPATRVDGPGGIVTYCYAALPKGVFKIGSHDASAATQAEVTVNTKARAPFVERVRLTSAKGFRMMLVASVRSMTLTSRYRLLADGHPVPDGGTSEIAGSMMGKSGAIRATVGYADVVRVR